jgi:hypothetical protein
MRLSKSPSKVFCPSVCIANIIPLLVAVEDVLKYSYGRLEHFAAKLGGSWHLKIPRFMIQLRRYN